MSTKGLAKRAPKKIARSEGVLEARGVAEVLQLPFFRVAIPVHAKAAADYKLMRACSPEQAGGSGAGRPGKTQAWTEVIVFCGDTAGDIAARISGISKPRRSARIDIGGLRTAGVEQTMPKPLN